MLRDRWIIVTAGVVLAGTFLAARTTPATEAQRRWWSHLTVLAGDELQGRATGTDGYDRAAAYVVGQFERAGLRPGANGRFLQSIGFRSRRIVEDRSSLTLVRDGQNHPVALGPDATISMRVDPAPAVEAPMVFVGYGLSIPEAQHDDLAGIDLRGRIAVFLAGSPAGIPGPLRAHAQSAQVRWAALRAAGAVGTISIANPRSSDVPWARSSANRLQPSVALAEPGFDPTPGQQIAVTFNPARAEMLFEGSPHRFADVLTTADAGGALPRFPLIGTLKARVAVDRADVTSANVVGILPGADPTLSREYVVLSAHLDHAGVGAAIDGDAIYNGAMDNASGTATLIEVAHALGAATPKPKRSLVFLGVTAEENGLLGSQYFARRPTVPARDIVANINMDMFLPLFPLKTVMILGLDESDLGDDVRRVAAAQTLGVQADPEPQRNRFTRSDQYSFIRQGVPALAMKVGYDPGSPEAAVAAAWTRERYHAPSDDLGQPIDLQSAADFTRWVTALTAAVADRPSRPAWRPDSFFRRFAPSDKGTGLPEPR